MQQAEETMASKSVEYHQLKSKREILEADVRLMRPDSLDADMVDEQARRTLGYMKSDEIVINLK